MKKTNLFLSIAFVLALSILVNAYESGTQIPVGTKADNSAMNKRDASGQTLTPMDQNKGSKTDVEITRQIREKLMDDKSLSVNAHNVKIITVKGMTTLRGTVNSIDERAKVAGIAESFAPATHVKNYLEVKTK